MARFGLALTVTRDTWKTIVPVCSPHGHHSGTKRRLTTLAKVALSPTILVEILT